MGITEALTIVFIVLKVINKIDWSWFWVLFPEIIAGVAYFALIIFATIIKIKTFYLR